jgi:hypothetical protein
MSYNSSFNFFALPSNLISHFWIWTTVPQRLFEILVVPLQILMCLTYKHLYMDRSYFLRLYFPLLFSWNFNTSVLILSLTYITKPPGFLSYLATYFLPMMQLDYPAVLQVSLPAQLPAKPKILSESTKAFFINFTFNRSVLKNSNLCVSFTLLISLLNHFCLWFAFSFL